MLVDELIEIAGGSHVSTDPAVIVGYCTDWTGHLGGLALAVVRPADASEVAAVLSACVHHGVAVIPQGGNTGLVQGGVPDRDTSAPVIIISTVRLNTIEPVDELSGQVTVGAGTTLADVQRAVRAVGWEYAIDLAARDSATIGGTVATNAGGIHVIAYGMTRAQVTGIQAALPLTSPTLIDHLAGLAKDNTGYDLAGALTGSEGTLAVITAVRVKLHRPMGRTSLALIGTDSYDTALRLISSAVRPGIRVRAAELMDRFGLEITLGLIGQSSPLAREHEVVLLLEIADGGDASGFVADELSERDVVIAIEAANQEQLWGLRERHTEAYSAFCTQQGLPAPHKLDVSIPLERLADCARSLNDRVRVHPGVVAFGMFGHAGDGNLHVQACGPATDDESVTELILSIVAECGGSVSAEHGIGRMKAKWLPLSRSSHEIAVMRAIKGAWDPTGVMNPGVLFSE
ncbi:MAG: FAD-binding oxidoreductase [Actinobacteria bacterium]|nr:FAD-binding oxidoreductase [Actinomycetota bacterium]